MPRDTDNQSSKERLKPRRYQEEALQFAKQRNAIVFLDTGAGKTLVAILLIEHLFHTREKKKLCFFLVTTVNLVDQQAEAIRRTTGVQVRSLHGDQRGEGNFDQASPDNWEEYLAEADVVVSVA